MALKYFNVINGITVGNITLDATTGNATVTNLAVTGNANLTAASNVALGSNSNVKLTGGSAGQYLQTDGSGNLSWQSISSATAIANGTSNVNIPAANGNVVVSVNGVANIATFTSNAVFRGSYGLTGIISQSNTAPSSPQNGDQWYNTFNGILFEYLDDGTSSQWVDISSLPLPNLSTSNASAVLNNVQSTGTYFPAFISSTANGNYALSSNTAFSANLANGAMIATTFVGALSGAATSATTAGTVTTAAQPNITSVGTLTSLGVNGTVTAVAFTANTGVFTGNANGLSSIVGANVSGTVASATSATNASALLQNTSTATTVYPTFSTSSANGNSSAVINTGISANLGNASITATTFVGALSGAATSATTAGTVTTAAQPNITSVGTLTSLGVSGTVTASAFTANTGVFTGNGSGLSAIAGANVTGTVASATAATNASALLQNTSTATTVYPTFSTSSANGNSQAVFNTGISANLGNASITATTFVGALSGAATSATTAGTVTTAAQPNITSVGTLTDLNVTGNAIVGGNLTINGNLTYLNVETLAVEDPIIQLQTGANGAAPIANSGKDVGSALNYFDTAARVAFMGWDVSNVEFGLASVASITNEVVTFTTYGNLRVGNIIGNGQALTALTGANVTGTVANATFATSASTAGTVTTAAQPNITSVGTLTSLGVNGTVTAVAFTANTGVFTGNANGLSSIVGANVTGTVATANNSSFLGGTAAASYLLTTGTGSSLTAITGANVTGTVSSATTAGTVTTAAQGNITSVGTLTGLGVNGTITAVNITANTGVFAGSGANLTTLNASNVSSGTLAQARLANASVTLGSTALTLGSTVTTVAGLTSVTSTTFVGALTGAATTAGSVTTAAQGNITSVGTLTGLTLANAAVISVGSNTNVGTFTGNWSLSAGSRLTATYADIAEKYVADATYIPGTVLMFGGEFEVTLANTFDSTKVAGVVTTNPAYSMNSALEAEYVAEIALQGRVPCKVIGPIEKGDLMVSASNGHATANNDARAGTIIGKALENFNGDFGVIEVAVGRF